MNTQISTEHFQNPDTMMSLTSGTPCLFPLLSRCRAGRPPGWTRPPPGHHGWRPAPAHWSWPSGGENKS